MGADLMKTTTEMQLVPITKLVPYVNNARTHSPEQINKLRSSLREFGFINPVIIDRDYGVSAGHGRILAAKEEGISEVPCVFADHLTEVQKKAYIIADNQADGVRCGDNGIFKGMPVTEEQKKLSQIARDIFSVYPYDGKYILDGGRLILCQSNAPSDALREMYPNAEINPLGDWTGGTDVDTGATNRKLGSDMAESVTGGGLHGKDLSKADVSVNIYAFLKAQETGKPVTLCCAIGDDTVDGRPYEKIVEIARNYIRSVGGFEKFAEWGLV